MHWTGEVDVCNAALMHLGAEPITALNEPTQSARVAKQFYATARDAVLRAYPWNFAIARHRLDTPIVDDTDLPREVNRFELPREPKVLRVWRVSPSRLPWRVEGRHLLIDAMSVDITVINQVSDVAAMDALMQTAFAAHLAEMMAYPITRERANVQLMRALYEAALEEAREIDSQEGTPTILRATRLIDARHGYRHPDDASPFDA